MKWGMATWIFLHTLSVQIPEEKYNVVKTELFNHIKNLCACLPCPDCAQHATQYMAQMRVPATKQDFIVMLVTFHNHVNQKNKKPLFPLLQIKKYNVVNLTLVFNMCRHIFTHQPYNPRIIMNKFKTHQFMNSFSIWLKQHQLIKA